MKRYLNSITVHGVFLSCLLLNTKCGVTVGNSGPPSVTTPDDETTALVGMQIDEAMGSSADQSSSDAVADTALVADSTTCTEDAIAGTAKLEGNVSLTTSLEVGKATRRRTISDATKKDFSILFAQTSGLDAITCNANNRPIISWTQLARLKTTETLKKTRTRIVTLNSDSSTLRSSSLVATTDRTNAFSRDLLSLTSITYSKSTSFATTIQLTEGTDTIERSIKTLENDPIILQRTLKRGTGLTEAKIVSGSTQSTRADGKIVILHYQDLQLTIGDSCLPSSGRITGDIYADASATTAAQSIVVTFSDTGAVLSIDGGEEAELDLETCKL